MPLIDKVKNIFRQRVVRHSLVYLLSNLFNSLIPFVLLPSYTANLEPSELGVLSLFDTTLLFIVPIIMFGFSGVISVEFFKSPKTFTKMFSAGIVVPLTAYLIILVVGLITYQLGFWSVSSEVNLYTISIIFTVAILQVVTQIRLVLLQAMSKPGHYFLLQAWVILSSVFLTLFFVINKNMGWEGRITALVITFGVASIISVYSFIVDRFLILKKFNLIDYFAVAKLGFPLVPHALGMIVIMIFDRYLIAYYWGVDELGLYVVGHQIGMGISMLQNSFSQAWGPICFRELSKNTIEAKYKLLRISYLFAFGIFLCALLLVMFSHAIYDMFIDESYHASIVYVKYIAFGFAFTGLYKLVVNYIFYEKKTYLLARIAILNVIVNVLLNFLLIPLYGAQGAALSFLISMVTVFIFTAVSSQLIFPMPWFEIRKILSKEM